MKQCVWTILDNKELQELNGGDSNKKFDWAKLDSK